MSLSEKRAAKFLRNILLEKLLTDLNGDLQPSERKLIAHYEGIKRMVHPLILVMGPLRSGTTLFTQWLASTHLAAYPTNLLSRFYQAPIIGAKIQLLLTDPRFNFRDELGEFTQREEYGSENGKTKGALAPNEFWYFWRRFLREPTRDVWTDEELRQTMDTQTMLAELIGIMEVFQKPFATKGMIFNYNIPFLDSILDKALFVQVKRDPVANVASVLEARRRQFGDDAVWYSFKIPEYEELQGLDPITQSAMQVHYINRAVTRGISSIDQSRRLVVQYEDFCDNPEKIFKQLSAKLGLSETKYMGPASFDNKRVVNPLDRDRIERALNS